MMIFGLVFGFSLFLTCNSQHDELATKRDLESLLNRISSLEVSKQKMEVEIQSLKIRNSNLEAKLKTKQGLIFFK